jgi:Cdc6-like AAA superfamily ATPase
MTTTAIPQPIGETKSFDAILERFQKLTPRERPENHGEADPIKADELFRAARVPERHARKTELAGAEWHACFGTIRAKLQTGFLFALIGTRGTGKTQMASELIRENSKRSRASRFLLAMDIFLAIRSSYRKDATTDEARVVEEFCKPRLLVIDEIQERAETPFEDRILTHILNRRYNDEKDTLLLGNVTQDEFKKAMGPSIVSRLNETGGLISCDWPSYR